MLLYFSLGERLLTAPEGIGVLRLTGEVNRIDRLSIRLVPDMRGPEEGSTCSIKARKLTRRWLMSADQLGITFYRSPS